MQMKTSKGPRSPQDAINLMLEFILGLGIQPWDTTSIGQYFSSGHINLTKLKVNINIFSDIMDYQKLSSNYSLPQMNTVPSNWWHQLDDWSVM